MEVAGVYGKNSLEARNCDLKWNTPPENQHFLPENMTPGRRHSYEKPSFSGFRVRLFGSVSYKML